MKAKFSALILAAAFVSGPALAQAPAAAPAKPSLVARMMAAKHATAKPAAKVAAPVAATPAANGKGQVQRTAKSLDCSKQADAKNIHGQARKSFMSHCKKA